MASGKRGGPIPVRAIWIAALIGGLVIGAVVAARAGQANPGLLAGAATIVVLYILISLGWGFMEGLRPATRCPKCGYDLTGLERQDDGSRICPECGTKVVWKGRSDGEALGNRQ